MSDRTIGRVLVANRGEIALRIMRTCREMGIETVAVYGHGEDQAQHVLSADHAWRIAEGAGLPYLRIDSLIDIARKADVDAVHPGYGFLAENAAFAQAVTDAGLVFIGPPAEAISLMGDKVEARRVATDAGVQPVPGTTGPISTVEDAQAWADEHGYPVAVKASGGGGGRGFRVAHVSDELRNAFEGSRGEAERYFSNPEVYLERYIERPRHIEVQVFADAHGSVVAFPERECSIQRRHQKLIEETPSPAVDGALREKLMRATVDLAKAVDYRGVGTIEYLLDDTGSFYFLEMNTRIQVEHTVTEMVTGIDLVREQLCVAQGSPLSFDRDEMVPRGWSIECRVNAEDAAKQFAPSTGTISRYSVPVGFGVRVDGAFVAGDTILPTYDSMIAKLVTWGRNRDEAIDRMRRALGDYEIGGVPTTIPFHMQVLSHPAFLRGETSTSFLIDHPEVLDLPCHDTDVATEAADPAGRMDLVVEVNGRRFDVAVAGLPVNGNGRKPGRQQRPDRPKPGSTGAATGNDLVSPIQGTVLRVAAEVGQIVAMGNLICVVEAMKMENEMTAHRDGVIRTLSVETGGTVQIGAVVATIEDEA